MDKFGIFKLLSSFFNFYEQSKNQKTEQDSPNNDLIENILSQFKPKDMPKKDYEVKKPENKNTTVPLQSSMLYTMQAHDKFIDRVKSKNPNK